MTSTTRTGLEIAVIGLAGNYPRSRNAQQLWQHLCAGEELLQRFTLEQAKEWGVEPDWIKHPDFQPVHGIMEQHDQFDAAFFGLNPLEAQVMDPQQRWFLTCCWEALENAGYNGQRFAGAVGVFGGTSINDYLHDNVLRNSQSLRNVGRYRANMANIDDFLTTSVSYRLNLRGPSMCLQTACSTSLVAIHVAAQQLLAGACDMALAGGSSFRVPHRRGYLYEEGGILSPDGHCRAFDNRAAGTVAGDGVGVVVLKRLEDAEADGDRIDAIILGSAVNNDGHEKIGFTAPSLQGQVQVVEAASLMADIDLDSISYVEAHGTGTALGDPIEVGALTQAFRRDTDRSQFCYLGSVKSNLGHLDAAAGVTGFIKAVLALKHQRVPASLYFQEGNSQIDWENSPFKVAQQLSPLVRQDAPLRAGVNAFGIGGTNAHVVLEEGVPVKAKAGRSQYWQIFPLSAKTSDALRSQQESFGQSLSTHSLMAPQDVAWTLQEGRAEFKHRAAVVGNDLEDVVEQLYEDKPGMERGQALENFADPVWLFPGQGAQYVGMGKECYEHIETFRQVVDQCCDFLQPRINADLRTVMFSSDAEQLKQTQFAQPALFTIQMALAKVWMERGVRASAFIGHSIGEITAACLSGVLSLEEALTLVVHRANAMQSQPSGSMLSVAASVEQLTPFLTPTVTIAAFNAPNLQVVAGQAQDIEALRLQLQAQGIAAKPLHTSHAFHSPHIEGAMPVLRDAIAHMSFKPATVALYSTVTGTLGDADTVSHSQYWLDNLRQSVRFSQACGQALKDGHRAFLEVGPGNSLVSLLKQHPEGRQVCAVNSLPRARDTINDTEQLARAAAKLWVHGANLKWQHWHESSEQPHRVALPTYPFEMTSFWLKPDIDVSASTHKPSQPVMPEKREDLNTWFARPGWRSCPTVSQSGKRVCLYFVESDMVSGVLSHTQLLGQTAVIVERGSQWQELSPYHYALNPSQANAFDALWVALEKAHITVDDIGYAWTALGAGLGDKEAERRCMFEPLHFVQSLMNRKSQAPVAVRFFTHQAFSLDQEPVANPIQSLCLGPARVVSQEASHISAGVVEIPKLSAAVITKETSFALSGSLVLSRASRRWVEHFDQETMVNDAAQIPEHSVALITGGLGGMGLESARWLAQHGCRQLVLCGRSAFADRAQWDQCTGNQADVVQRIRQIESLGAQVEYARLDIADAEETHALVASTVERYGRLDVLVHAAGLAEDAILLNKTDDTVVRVLAPKVSGTRNLLKALELNASIDRPARAVFMSSLAAQLVGIGRVDYCAANAYLDAVAWRYADHPYLKVQSINWDTWQGVGMVTKMKVSKDMEELLEDAISQSITPEEGVACLARAIASNAPQVMVSTKDIDLMVQHFTRLNTQRRETVTPQPAAVASAQSEDSLDSSLTPVEQTIAQIWQDLIGVTQIGPQDDFFDLGGHSLLATQVVSRIREQLDVQVAMRDLLEAGTLSGWAKRVESLLAEVVEECEELEI